MSNITRLQYRLILAACVASFLASLPAFASRRPSGLYPVGAAPKYVIIQDLNGDGVPDVVTANFNDNTISVLLGISNGNFAAAVEYPVGPNPTSIAATDFNEDGRIDLVVANVNKTCTNCTASLSLLLGNGDGTFRPATSIAVDGMSAAVATGDLNNDGHADIVAGDSNRIFVLLGHGDGTFAPPVGFTAGDTAHNIVLWDFNFDGNLDIAVANYDSNDVAVLMGNGDGTFKSPVNYPVGSNPHNVILADVNGDHFVDLITANQNSNNISVLLGNPDGTFQSAVNYASSPNPSSIAAIDYDLDGKIDLAVTNSGCVSGGDCNFGPSNVLLFHNIGGGRFQSSLVYSVGTGADAIASGDLDGDGKTDLAVGGLEANTLEILISAGNGTFK